LVEERSAQQCRAERLNDKQQTVRRTTAQPTAGGFFDAPMRTLSRFKFTFSVLKDVILKVLKVI
jgi:hypothetical protein